MDDADIVVRHYKLDVDAYRRMAEAGIFGEEDRVELIDGELISMPPIGTDHAATVDGLTEKLVLACAGRAIVSVQNPVRIDRFSEPQPDLAVSKLRRDRYRTGRAGPADILLLVEVADSSLRFDRMIKLPLYARAGVGEVWIVDLERRVLEVHRRPEGGAYTDVTRYEPGETVTLALVPEISVTLTEIFD